MELAPATAMIFGAAGGIGSAVITLPCIFVHSRYILQLKATPRYTLGVLMFVVALFGMLCGAMSLFRQLTEWQWNQIHSTEAAIRQSSEDGQLPSRDAD